MDQVSLEHEIGKIAEGSEVFRLPVDGESLDGEMVFRQWHRGADETLVLLHGGSGSWTHWLRNIEVLRAKFNVIAPDLPGLGDSAELPEGYTAQDVAGRVERGLKQLLGEETPFHLVAFSWGCVVASLIAQVCAIKSLMLVGPGALGDIKWRSQMQPLLRRNKDMTRAEIFATHRENLARLMIHDRSRIDDMAVLLQTLNTNRSRFNSPQFARSTLVLDGVENIQAPLSVIYGEFDAPAYPHIHVREQLLRERRADMAFEVIEDAGHWVQYERPDIFNDKCLRWLAANSG